MSAGDALRLRGMVLQLSELLQEATQGEPDPGFRQRMEEVQRQAYAVAHPDLVAPTPPEEGPRVLEGEAVLEQPDTSDPEVGPPYELVVGGRALADFVEERFDVVEHQYLSGHRMKLGRLRVTVEDVEEGP